MKDSARYALSTCLAVSWVLTIPGATDHRKQLVKSHEQGYQQGFKDGVASVNLQSVLTGSQKRQISSALFGGLA